MRTCSIGECKAKHVAHGLCRKHYSRWRVHGDVNRGRPSMEERLWAKVDADGDCWLWTSATGRGGYGLLWIGGDRRSAPAHRLVWELLVGPIPDGLTLDHLCRNPPCVNPDHLEPIGAVENTLRGFGITAKNARKTHCKSGHEFTPETTHYRKDGARTCLVCLRRWNKEARARKKAQS